MPHPVALNLALESEHAATRILLSETEQETSLSAVLTSSTTNPGDRSHALAIGPEGGWTPDEMALFTAQGWTHVTLGPRILRAETAAIAAIAIAGTHLGN
jgi:16S rRNA (uracil1498-N3)-methyltransferase